MLSVMVSIMSVVGSISSSGITPAKAETDIKLRAPAITKYFILISKQILKVSLTTCDLHLPSERKVEADLGVVAKNHATTAHCHSVFMHCDYRGLMLDSLGFVKGCADGVQT